MRLLICLQRLTLKLTLSLNFSLCGSVSDHPAAALGTLQALSREGPGLLPEWRRVLRHRDAQRATQALQVSDRNHNVAAAAVVGKHLLYLLLPPEHHSSLFFFPPHRQFVWQRLFSGMVLMLLAKPRY